MEDEEREYAKKSDVIEELINIRSYLLSRVELTDSIILEYVSKSDIYETMDDESLSRLLRNCICFHKNFKKMKSSAKRMYEVLCSNNIQYDMPVSLTTPRQLKMKEEAWKVIMDYYNKFKNEDSVSEE